MTADSTVTANFAIDTYALSYRPVRAARHRRHARRRWTTAGRQRGHGHPGDGYHFVDWSDGGDRARTDTT